MVTPPAGAGKPWLPAVGVGWKDGTCQPPAQTGLSGFLMMTVRGFVSFSQLSPSLSHHALPADLSSRKEPLHVWIRPPINCPIKLARRLSSAIIEGFSRHPGLPWPWGLPSGCVGDRPHGLSLRLPAAYVHPASLVMND